ncbi:uncharacterized protein SPSK_03717 [Sporothrix schenckii 1099-18]|uniref:Uncharacterized protein n=1 Tax=Sporothrix schenckii 1099-18 TaxID=1397361 RepID=A0A0F2LXG2_SPOSC|nr:uncharacterized protein SPSK_03717 [Sporothrix schenckii 1099-18]KJR82152.1 hypothetical protein SPSK_03717 [Sporothrix schenckii 1099-18]
MKHAEEQPPPVRAKQRRLGRNARDDQDGDDTTYKSLASQPRFMRTPPGGPVHARYRSSDHNHIVPGHRRQSAAIPLQSSLAWTDTMSAQSHTHMVVHASQ